MRVLLQSLQHIPEPLPWIDAHRFAGREKRVHHGCSLAGIMGAAEQVIFTADGHGSNRVFNQIIIDFNPTVGQINFQLWQLIDGIV